MARRRRGGLSGAMIYVFFKYFTNLLIGFPISTFSLFNSLSTVPLDAASLIFIILLMKCVLLVRISSNVFSCFLIFCILHARFGALILGQTAPKLSKSYREHVSSVNTPLIYKPTNQNLNSHQTYVPTFSTPRIPQGQVTNNIR